MNQHPQVGHNVTGASSNSSLSQAMQQGMDQYPPTSVGTTEGAGKVRIEYAKEGLPVGSIPKPVETKEKLKAAVGAGPSPMLMDKLGERLAFERTGTRLYEAIISKHEAYGGFDGGPSRADLLEILNEEHSHFKQLESTIRELGGDPTAVTPSANLAAVASEGVQKVITDARTSLLQSLEAILIAELVDRDSWSMLCEAVRSHGLRDFAEFCERAEQTEEQHLSKVRAWVMAGQHLPG